MCVQVVRILILYHKRKDGLHQTRPVSGGSLAIANTGSRHMKRTDGREVRSDNVQTDPERMQKRDFYWIQA